ncbi:MAG: PolC-type DNA polymerase III [Lachnospiraceae bacterium]|nr:PolC-type DNA polymerase III [Lachnospiraceae bacterium]
MEKLFFDVFPTLEAEDRLKQLLSEAQVTRVTKTRRGDLLCVYLNSPVVIEKTDIRKLEKAIAGQVSPDARMNVRIRESFVLPGDVGAESFFRGYEESFLLELKEEDPVLFAMLKKAELAFPDSHSIHVSLPDGPVERHGADKLSEVLRRLLAERAGFREPQVNCEFVPREEPEEVAPVPYVPERRIVMPPANASFGGPERRSTITVKPVDPAQGKRRKKQEGNPEDMLYGRPFADAPVAIETIDAGTTSVVVIEGEVTGLADRSVKNGKRMITFGVHDDTDSIGVKCFIAEEDADQLIRNLKEQGYVRVKGEPKYDTYDREVAIAFPIGIAKAERRLSSRADTAEKKRVELHIHSTMSDMDAVSDAASLVRQAYEWGMPGIAVTDHGVVQALTEATKAWGKLYGKACDKAKEEGKEKPDRQDFFKIVPAMECYLVDDTKSAVTNASGQTLADSSYVVFDLETTGFSPHKNSIIEFGAVRIEKGQIVSRFSEFVNPGIPIPARITQLTHITDAMVREAQAVEEVLPRFLEFAKDAVLVGHNVAFDAAFIYEKSAAQGIDVHFTTLDTMGLSRMFFPKQGRHSLDAVAKTLKVELKTHHRAVDDSEATAGIFLRFLDMLKEQGAQTVDDVARLSRMSIDAAKHLRPHHAVLLAKNTTGRVNLYTLVSKSHVEYFHRYPLVPLSVLMQHREGLLVGSADANGELWQAVAEGRRKSEIEEMAARYDYFEVQPPENYAYMIDHPRYESIGSMEDLREINRQIIALGAKLGKPVCATSDAHFLNPQDVTFRTILLEGKDIKGGKDGVKADASKNVKKDDEAAPLYFRTTDEMCEAFSDLDEETVREIVVEAPRRILDMCDAVPFVRPDKCPPVIEDSDKTLRALCYEKAERIYGSPLPQIVEARLEKELNSIIGNGFAVMYIIAQKLVSKSLSDGYIVGSRGSVGSSFVAFASGITEVNALPPHYVCPSCRYSDFDSEEVRAYAGNSGCDMPDKACPVCGTKLYKDGFDIPFETFLGFHGEKEPDIDLNFSGEYQATAHKYTEEIFGKGQTYRAGTVSGLQDKTAYGVVKKYLEYNHITKRKPEIDRLVQGLSGVRHGTGQHPGGIIVLPIGEDINSFTPVQHPANKSDTDTITTHYDYHSIDHNLLKLDILGHDDPTMVRFLHDATGIDPTQAPLDDPEVMQLFKDTSSLRIDPAQIGGTKLGCLGLPEFGTDFAMQMVLDAKPTSFSHLIRIAGLAHGTDVWIGNARDLILNGTATIETAICNRDDIMNYLIHKGVDPQLSFNAMERVRKGKGLSDEMKTAMINAQVPDWYIDSCQKIQYMFPKAHATAYVMNAWRIAWFKVHEPLAFYAAWFSIRAKAVSYKNMCQGVAHLAEVMADYEHREKELSNVEQLAYGDMRVAQEMYARGYEFAPIDLFRAHAEKFQVIDGKIMPAFVAIDGMGPVAAEGVYAAAKDGAFLSRDDFKERTKCPTAVMETMAELGILGDIPESNQISLFDML